jgi:type I restriction enzyme S subunit
MSSEGVDAVSGEGDQAKGLVPKLRFPEFRDAGVWTNTALKTALRPVSREVAKPELSYTGLGLRSHGKGTFQKPEQNPDKNAMDRLYVVHSSDLVVNITFAWEGAIAIANKGDHGSYVSHRFPTYEFHEGVSSPDFFRYVITDKAFVYRLGVISPGGAGRNRVLNKNDFLRLSILLPSQAEQQKIADCLSSLDAVIAAEGDRLAALKDHKKGLMQRLFPTKDQTTPRLRFPEFEGAGDWEVKPLGV